MAELQVRVPYTAWGLGDGWHEAYDQVLEDLFDAVEAAGVEADDSDHFADFVCFYLLGDDVDALRRVAREVFTRHGLLTAATAMVTDPDADDMDVGAPVDLQLGLSR